ncbi:MAG TPA: VanZ family protein [Terriglobales bacterium]|jgi:VanZ family protein
MLLRIVKAWLPVVAMCAIIFFFSQDANSGQHSDEVLSWILNLVGMNSHHWHRLLDAPFRKFAHIVVYFLLGMVTYRGFAMGSEKYSLPAGFRSFVFCAAYAATDEFHQSFIKGRGPSVHDVMLDSAAAALALFLLWLWKRSRTSGPRLTASVHHQSSVAH